MRPVRSARRLCGSRGRVAWCSVAAALVCVTAMASAPSASAALRSPKLFSSCPSGSSYKEKTSGPFRLEGCLKEFPDRWETARPKAELNGFDVGFLPVNRGELSTLSISRTGQARVFSTGNIKLKLVGGPINVTLFNGPIDLTVPGASASFAPGRAAGSQPFEFELDVAEQAKLLGLDIEGDVQGKLRFSLTSSAVEVGTNLKFPQILGGATFAGTLRWVDGQGLQLEGLEINSGPTAIPLGNPAVLVKEVGFRFTAPDNLTLGGKLVIPNLTPQAFGVTIRINSSGLQEITGSVGGANLPILPPVIFLQGGSVTVGVNPLTIGGNIELSFLPVEEASNAFVLKSTGGYRFTFGDPFIIQLIGTTRMLGIGPLQGGSGTETVTYTSDHVLSIDRVASMTFGEAGVGSIQTTANLEGSVSPNGFRASGTWTGSAGAFGLTLSGTGSVRANGRGIGGCLSGEVFGASASVQARMDWGESPEFSLGCNLDRFRERSLPGRAVASASGQVEVPAGATNAAVRVQATGPEAPDFNLRLPDGTLLEVRDPISDAKAVGGRALYRADAPGVTTVYINTPPTGVWTVEEIAGHPLGEITSADDAPPSVNATVSGKGEARALNWQVSDLDGGRLQISEVQRNGKSNVLVDTDKASGSQEFKVPFGRAGRRRLTAVVTGVDEIPRLTLPAGEYRAPKPFVPRPPRDIVVRHSRGRLSDRHGNVSGNRAEGTLTFSQVPPRNVDNRPDWWMYKILMGDGRVLYVQGFGADTIKVPDVRPGTAYKVSVFGVEDEGLRGKPRTERGEA